MRKILFIVLLAYGIFNSAYADGTFTVTTANLSAGTTFSFQMSAAGNFIINWGDIDCSETKTDANGTPCIQTINKSTTTLQTYSYTYETAGTYNIGLSGNATEYSTERIWNQNSGAADDQWYTQSSISFSNNTNLAGITGSLGQIFSTLQDGNNPSFHKTFYECSNLSGSIPSELFNGISGAPVQGMFSSLFFNDNKLTGTIPENLFPVFDGPPTSDMFDCCFIGCSGLTGSIPHNLFYGIKGSPKPRLFAGCFNGCSGLTGSIPHDLFANITGTPQTAMFYHTFKNCYNLTGSIPPDLFAGISGPAQASMFWQTFYNCSQLSGYIPQRLFANITGNETNSYSETFYYTGLSYSCPQGTQSATTGYGFSSLNSRVVCSPICETEKYLNSLGYCQDLCSIPEVKYLNTSTGIKIPLYDTQQTTPSLVVEYNESQCFGNLIKGENSNSLIFTIDGVKYHATN